MSEPDSPANVFVPDPIEDSNDSSSSVSFADNTDLFYRDKEKLLQIFPPEVWVLVSEAKNLKSSDLTTMTLASPYFRSILHFQKVHFLFSKVWDILWKQQYPIKTRTSLYTPMIEGKDIFSLRQVCTSWCTIMTNFQDNDPSRLILEHDYYPQHLRKDSERYPTQVEFSEREPIYAENFIKRYQQKFGAKENLTNPFTLGRGIEISLETIDTPFYFRMKDILAKYGHGVWYCVICGFDDVDNPILSYKGFRELIELMPNLVCLNWLFYQEEVVAGEQALAIEAELRDLVFPCLKNLKFLSASNLPEPILNHVIHQNSHLKILEIEQSPENGHNQFQFGDLTNLELLSLNCLNQGTIESLQTFSTSCTLSKLFLEMENCDYFQWSVLFDCLSAHFAQKLTDLTMSFSRVENLVDQEIILREYSCHALKLPLVKRLKLVLRNVCYLDFILPLQNNLEILEIVVQWDKHDAENSAYTEEGKKLQKIGFLGYYETYQKPKLIMYSNIWTLFPKLKQLDIWDHYKPHQIIVDPVERCTKNKDKLFRGATREEWKYFCEQPGCSKAFNLQYNNRI